MGVTKLVVNVIHKKIRVVGGRDFRNKEPLVDIFQPVNNIIPFPRSVKSVFLSTMTSPLMKINHSLYSTRVLELCSKMELPLEHNVFEIFNKIKSDNDRELFFINLFHGPLNGADLSSVFNMMNNTTIGKDMFKQLFDNVSLLSNAEDYDKFKSMLMSLKLFFVKNSFEDMVKFIRTFKILDFNYCGVSDRSHKINISKMAFSLICDQIEFDYFNRFIFAYVKNEACYIPSSGITSSEVTVKDVDNNWYEPKE